MEKNITESANSSNRNMTEEEKRRNIVENYNTSFFVEAGAGAGKTRLIVDRVFNQLLAGIAPESIVVITFTNMATEELKERIERKVRDNRDKFKDGNIPEVDSIQISTIHGFCSRLLDEQVFNARLPLDKEIIDEDENNEIIDKVFTDYLGQIDSDTRNIIYGVGKDAKDSIKKVRKLYTSICKLPENYEIIEPDNKYPTSIYDYETRADNIVKAFYKEYTSFDDKWDGMDERRKKLTSSRAFNAFLGEKCRCRTNYDKKKALAQIIKAAEKEKKSGSFVFFKGDKTKTWHDRIDELDEALRDWYFRNKEEITCLSEYESEMICKEAIKARDYYRNNRPKNKISNNQLIELAEKLVRENSVARDYFSNRYKYIYVDEFQDTDSIQTSLVTQLGEKAVLFLVGDPKQSIYRFRGAEPKEYYRIKHEMEERQNTEVVTLSYNFRSGKEIVDWVNENFKNRDMLDEGGEYIPMECRKPDLLSASDKELQNNGKVISGVYNCHREDIVAKAQECIDDAVTESGETEKDEKDAKKYSVDEDCRLVADLVCALTNTELGYRITDYRQEKYLSDTGEECIHEVAFTRAIKKSDILILCPGMKDMGVYYDELISRGISVNMSGEKILGQTYIVRLYVRLCRYLADKYKQGNRLSVVEAYRIKDIGSDDINNLLEHLIKETNGMSAYGIANYLLENTYWVPGGIPKEEYMFNLLQIKEKAVETCDKNGIELIRLMEKLVNYKFERILSDMDDGNSVRFMNFHKAKGLQGKIVILASRVAKRKEQPGDELVFDKVYYPKIYIGPSKYFTRCGAEAEKAKEALKVAAGKEGTRLEYVVATRAEQVFIFMDKICSEDIFFESGYTAEKNIYHVLDEYQNLKLHEKYITVDSGVSDEGEKTKVLANVTLKPVNSSAAYMSKSPSGYESASASRTRARKEWLKNDGKKTALEELRPDGNVLGTTMHRAFELLVSRLWFRTDNNDGDSVPKLIPMFVNQAIAESYKDIILEEKRKQKKLDSENQEKGQPAEKVNLIKQYQEFLNAALASFWKWMLEKRVLEGADNVYTELPFSYYAKEDKSEIWLNGEMDLLIHYKDGRMLLIDYKSDTDYFMDDAVLETTLGERYTGQLRKYREAVCRLFEEPEEKVDLGIVSFTQKGLTEGAAVRYTKLNI